MTQFSEEGSPAGAKSGTGLESGLNALVERLRALRSAWGVLAPSGLSSEKTDIAETGRALNDELMELAGRHASQPDFETMAEIESHLESLDGEMRGIAFKVPIAQLRSTLPECVSHDRRGVLDLLDLMLGAELLGLDGTRTRIPSIDYVITLLCSASSGQPLSDPVQLTPRLHDLCERNRVDYDPRLPEIEAEFFHAADMYEADTRGEHQLRALQSRKTELGPDYFSPQILRAIVTYNAALLNRIDEEVLASMDWGSLPPVAAEPRRTISAFDAAALPELAQALKRRAAGGAPEMSAVDRIAWCLDLEYPTAGERRALLIESEESSDRLTETVILIGLLCRASIVLEDEFPSIGITSTQLFDEWVPEVSEALQQKVNRGITGDDYREACLLSELKTRYLYTSMADIRRKNRASSPTPPPTVTSTPSPAPRTPPTEKTAKPIAQEALAKAQTAAANTRRPAWKDFPQRRVAAIGIAMVCALLIFGVVQTTQWGSDNARFDRDQLDQLSPYLSRGVRNEKGLGPAFVGEIRDSWSALEAPARTLEATNLVGVLRESGVRDVMIYDDDGFLRIQALGEQSPRVLPEAGPKSAL
jgi:hypothetical protein